MFDQANEGATEAHAELQNPAELSYTGPDQASSAQGGQVEFVTNAPTQGFNALMISNNSGDQIAPAAKAAADGGIKVVTWDSPIPSAEGESLFVAQVDFDETGVVMADMALEILGEAGGEFAVLSATPDAANQNAWIASLEETLKDPKYANLKLVDTVYGDDQSEKSYNQALALVDSHPDLKLIMAPTTVGIAAAAKAMQDEGLCDKVKVSGLGLPAEMEAYVPTAPRSSRCGRSSISATSRTTPRTCSRPVPSRASRASSSRPDGWAPTRSRRTRPATPGSGSSWVRSRSTTRPTWAADRSQPLDTRAPRSRGVAPVLFLDSGSGRRRGSES